MALYSVVAHATAGKHNCGSSSFTPISYACFFHCGSNSFNPISNSSFFHCRTAGAVVLPPFHILAFSTAGVRDCKCSSFIPISYSSFFQCRSAGLREQYFYPHFIFLLFPLREQQFYPHFIFIRTPTLTSGLREHAFNVTQSWPGILKSLRDS